MTTFGTRAMWWAVGCAAGAVLGWLIAESGGIFIGLLFLFPSSLIKGRLPRKRRNLVCGRSCRS